VKRTLFFLSFSSADKEYKEGNKTCQRREGFKAGPLALHPCPRSILGASHQKVERGRDVSLCPPPNTKGPGLFPRTVRMTTIDNPALFDRGKNDEHFSVCIDNPRQHSGGGKGKGEHGQSRIPNPLADYVKASLYVYQKSKPNGADHYS